MQSILAYLENVLATYWGQSKYQLFLYIAIIVILLMEKESWKKITFAWYGLVCFVGLLNPITVKITSKVWGESVAYYCRQISLIPIFIIIAYGIIRLLSIVEGEKKLILATFVTGLIVMNGYQIYQESWYTKADNYSKIPVQIIELAEFFEEQGETVRVAAPTNISAYLRQYENVVQIQGRNVWDGVIEEQLQSDRPDVINIMQHAGKLECDYIIVKGDELVQNIYTLAGYKPCFKMDMYLIYKVEGVERWRRIYDEKNRLEKKEYLDEYDDIIICAEVGYATIRYTYDIKGNKETEHYYDDEGNAIALSKGHYGVKYQYNDDKRISETIYVDQNDNPIITKNGYAIVKYTYDVKGNKDAEYYYDDEGNAIELSAGYYGIKYKYNDDKRISEVMYVDQNGKPVIIANGYAIVKYTYDEKGNKEAEYYYDDKGNAIVLSTC